jgi:hypothetical protein
MVAAAAVARVLGTLLVGVSPFDPLSFAAVPLMLAVGAAVNPVDALR